MADAVDDCGTGGHRCTSVAEAPAQASLGPDTGSPWVFFGDPNSTGALGNVTKSGSSTKISGIVSLGSQPAALISAGPTVFDSKGAAGMEPNGSSSGAVAFPGADGGFRLTAAAPATGSTSELTLYLGVEGGVVGTLSTSVFGVVGADEAFAISSSSNNSVVSLKYRGGPLDVRYTVAAGSRTCDVPTGATRWCCVRPPAQNSSVSLALSGANVLD